MQLNPYLTFKGQCEAAFKFYEKCLGGKIVAMVTHAGTPAELCWRIKSVRQRAGVCAGDPGFRPEKSCGAPNLSPAEVCGEG